ncbi:MAG: benzoyl-CoA oxygenase subunit B [Betaproteobacteria bacterium RIFCSPHIGHO2_12_FULL_69_13]|nr:MAG: benzoyl-CoA oxygenase subunit B [Betaproteobacteria bacterium RIFCSPHIGHO2_12_FULL_69_13]OGA69471.1 MAG: benzoyl-CoA oxygenase subunit B [Betaproteobacteria bacterium RIFCSPLOWO2_12_FULL_68_20]
MSAVNYSEKIPNNVNLANDRTLQRALEHWQPHFLQWWHEMGPTDFERADVYLRTAVSVDAQGWATYGAVHMPDYRWGIFLADAVPDRKIGFGDRMGEPAWQQVPGEYRSTLRRLLVTQGDTEPASVEQQRLLGHSCPSLYDLRNLFQVNVEEGRHLWAMVYLLHAYFGRDGREEAEELLARHSGDADKPRILTTFNEPILDWLSFYCFTYFTDRDGKYQLKSLAESAFDPLSRTCRFMLTEEAHHMFVGETGIGRVVKRTLEAMKELGTGDPARLREHGAVDLATLQKYLNFWCSSSLDLFGSEISSNSAANFANGLKGRPDEDQYEDHVLRGASMKVATPEGEQEVPVLNALNEVMRESYLKDCEIGLKRWNRTIERAGHEFRLSLPSARFRRAIGAWAGQPVDPLGKLLPEEEYSRRLHEWIPSQQDRDYVKSLMRRVAEPGKMASWIAPPERGINNLPLEYEYVRLS